MARTAERKLAIAKRICDLAVNKYGMRKQDLLFDPLVLPISTGIEEDRRNAAETIEGIRRISGELPDCHTVIGLSNVSFGLKPAGAGGAQQCLPARMPRSGPDGRDRACVEDPAANEDRGCEVECSDGFDLRSPRERRSVNAVYLTVCRGPAPGSKLQAQAELPLNERLQKHIIDGDKRDLEKDLTEAMGQWAAADDHQRASSGGDEGCRRAFRLWADAATVCAAVGRGDEGGRRLSPAVHGKSRGHHQGEDRPGHGQGRCARYREEPRRYHPHQQRLIPSTTWASSSRPRPFCMPRRSIQRTRLGCRGYWSRA